MATEQLAISAPGYPGTNATLRLINAMILENAAALAGLCGHKTILSGVIVGSSTTSDGWVVYEGEIMPFEGGVTNVNVTIIETTATATYDSDSNNDGVNDVAPISKSRIMKFGTGGVVEFPFSHLQRLKSILELSQFALPANLVIDGAYVHSDNNFTATLLAKLNAIEANAQVNVKPNWNAPEGATNEILNRPQGLMQFLRMPGTIWVGDVPTDTSITVTFPTPVATSEYFVLGNLKSYGADWNEDNDVIWMTEDHTQASFKLLLRDVGNNTNNLRFDYAIVSKAFS